MSLTRTPAAQSNSKHWIRVRSSSLSQQTWEESAGYREKFPLRVSLYEVKTIKALQSTAMQEHSLPVYGVPFALFLNVMRPLKDLLQQNISRPFTCLLQQNALSCVCFSKTPYALSQNSVHENIT